LAFFNVNGRVEIVNNLCKKNALKLKYVPLSGLNFLSSKQSIQNEGVLCIEIDTFEMLISFSIFFSFDFPKQTFDCSCEAS